MILAHTIPIALAGVQLTINQDMKALRPKSGAIDSIYLYSALKVSESRLLSQVRTAAHGTRKLDTDELLQIPILIPSQKMLNSFRQAFTTYREALAKIRKTHEILEHLYENLLHRAFSGNLTATWREAHMKDLLVEMEEQIKELSTSCATEG
jgi:type I restriction enzyme S subunit